MNLQKNALKALSLIAMIAVISLSFATPVEARTASFGDICVPKWNDNCDENPFWDKINLGNFNSYFVPPFGGEIFNFVYTVGNPSNNNFSMECSFYGREYNIEPGGGIGWTLDIEKIKQTGEFNEILECTNLETNETYTRNAADDLGSYLVLRNYQFANGRTISSSVQALSEVQCMSTNGSFNQFRLKPGERKDFRVQEYGNQDLGIKCTEVNFRPLNTTSGSLSLR